MVVVVVVVFGDSRWSSELLVCRWQQMLHQASVYRTSTSFRLGSLACGHIKP